MVLSGLEVLLGDFPRSLQGKRIGLLCHAPSINRDFEHITSLLGKRKDCSLAAIFGPQHGLHGQTQDNMIEWETGRHDGFGIPLFSLYGEHRKPTAEMLEKIDALIIDLQDTGTRIYTYPWTLKLCLEACTEAGIPVWVLDRPNPVSFLPADGPVLKKDYFTFVGGASIPLCHRMTIGEIAVWVKERYYPGCDLNLVSMKNWHRRMSYRDTGLPWVLPSPNMPTADTAVVYPGMVLAEALNLSEGRGTVIPFELFGAPFINAAALKRELLSRDLKGCAFREHDYIPTFHKFAGETCSGLQIHVTDYSTFRPVMTALHIFDAIIATSPDGALRFIDPPYEYEEKLIPFDILSGDDGMRNCLANRSSLKDETDRWSEEHVSFLVEFAETARYPE
jgi:uncharacterized protein YbbC (DUF1343 family)